jgi:nicotinate-nucleotide adenylyltransferase
MSHKVGVLGGTFDPPHNGHLALAAAARLQLGLHRVLWVVTADPPHKHAVVSAPVQDRLDMVAAAIVDPPGYEISRVDVDRPGPQLAAETVRLLSKALPGAALVYLMGGDSLRDFPTWGRPQDLLAQCTLGVLRRPGAAIDLAALEEPLPGISSRVAFVEAPRIGVSSHEVRRLVGLGQPIDELVPRPVAALIAARGLYRALAA